MNSSMYRNLTITALLMALAIMIPIMMPLKLSFHRLRIHWLVMYLYSWLCSCLVRWLLVLLLGSTLGFFVAGFPIVIVMRAASHIIFALMGAYYIKHHPGVLTGALSFATFNLVCAIVHAIGEVLACLLFYTTTTVPNIDLIYVVFVLVGGGTIIHSIVDGYIALYIYKAIPGLSKPENK